MLVFAPCMSVKVLQIPSRSFLPLPIGVVALPLWACTAGDNPATYKNFTETLLLNRCIKPNPESRPGSLTPPYVLEQLRAGGVLEAVRIASAGFPTRKPFK